MIDSLAILVSSLLVLFIAIRATVLDAKQYAESKEIVHWSTDET